MNTSVRTKTIRGLAASFAVLALNSPGLCNTWIVDQANGPGTNFTAIPPAIAAAVAGDVIIVRQGSYGTFTLTRGMTILGEGAVAITAPGVAVNAVPAGEIAALYNLRSSYAGTNGFVVDGCAGTVLLQRVDGPLRLHASVDIRILEATAHSFLDEAVRVVDSRVQFVQSTLYGRTGGDAVCGGGNQPAEPGHDALSCTGASRVHFALSVAGGGDGGYGAFDIGCNYGPALGGNGITTSGPISGVLQLILTGSQVQGGFGEFGGYDGKSLRVGANVTAWSAQTSYFPTAPFVAGGTLVQQPTKEPTLELIGTPAAGGMITLRLRAEPGTVARLNVGKPPIVQATPGILVEALVHKERSFDRGIVPPSGVIDSVWGFVPSAPAGKLLIFQARLVDPITGLAQRSNSIEAVVQ